MMIICRSPPWQYYYHHFLFLSYFFFSIPSLFTMCSSLFFVDRRHLVAVHSLSGSLHILSVTRPVSKSSSILARDFIETRWKGKNKKEEKREREREGLFSVETLPLLLFLLAVLASQRQSYSALLACNRTGGSLVSDWLEVTIFREKRQRIVGLSFLGRRAVFWNTDTATHQIAHLDFFSLNKIK